MNGLLHRLAARATGTARLVRSEAALPYTAKSLTWSESAQVPLLGDDAALADAGWEPTAASRSKSTLTQTAKEQDEANQADPAAASPTSQPVPEPMPQRRAATIVPVPAAQRGGPPASLAEDPHPPVARVRPAKPDAGSALPPIDADAVERAATRPAAHESPTLLERLRLVPHLASTNEPAATVRAQAQRSEPPGTSTELRDNAGAWTPSARPDSRLPAPATASSDDATEVHIHIGRIEVTAVHEAPKPRTKAAAKAPAMSLDAYLAARSRA